MAAVESLAGELALRLVASQLVRDVACFLLPPLHSWARAQAPAVSAQSGLALVLPANAGPTAAPVVSVQSPSGPFQNDSRQQAAFGKQSGAAPAQPFAAPVTSVKTTPGSPVENPKQAGSSGRAVAGCGSEGSGLGAPRNVPCESGGGGAGCGEWRTGLPLDEGLGLGLRAEVGVLRVRGGSIDVAGRVQTDGPSSGPSQGALATEAAAALPAGLQGWEKVWRRFRTMESRQLARMHCTVRLMLLPCEKKACQQDIDMCFQPHLQMETASAKCMCKGASC